MSSPEQLSSSENGPSLAEAAALMKTALVLLDEAEAPPDIGAHLDLAICRLDEILEAGSFTRRARLNRPADSHRPPQGSRPR